MRPRVTRWVRLSAAPSVVAVGVLVAATATAGTSEPEPSAASTTATSTALIADPAVLRTLPTSGPAWESLLDAADERPGRADLDDQGNRHAARTLAAALVHARTGDPAYRDKAVAQLRQVPEVSLRRARVLAVARQLAGYAIAADLVGHREPAFVEFMSTIRERELGNHGRWTSLTQTSEDTANNWGTWALASRLAASLYVRDNADVARAARVFRGYLGDRASYDDFRPTAAFDTTWICGDPAAWVPVNPARCGDRSGAAVEDIARSRGAYPRVDQEGLDYTWEVLGGITLSAALLHQAGYTDVYEWSDRAILRVAEFLEREGGFPAEYGSTRYITWDLNRAYGTDFPTGPVETAGYGRQFGFTDWLP